MASLDDYDKNINTKCYISDEKVYNLKRFQHIYIWKNFNFGYLYFDRVSLHLFLLEMKYTAIKFFTTYFLNFTIQSKNAITIFIKKCTAFPRFSINTLHPFGE